MSRTKGPDLFAESLPGPYLLFAAVAHRIVEDIRAPRPHRVLHKNGASTTLTHQRDAIECLVDPQGGVVEWAELLGLDGDWVREQLMVRAGLANSASHLDDNHFHPGETDELPG